uniref:hypothetical protein n=1 Tax=Acinetobacter baumannii TaxID=470 RepID=UPI003399D5C4
SKSYKSFHILSKKKVARHPTKPLASFSKKKNMISKRASKLNLISYLKPENKLFLKTYELSISGVVLSADMGTRVHFNSSLYKPCNKHGQIKNYGF